MTDASLARADWEAIREAENGNGTVGPAVQLSDTGTVFYHTLEDGGAKHCVKRV